MGKAFFDTAIKTACECLRRQGYVVNWVPDKKSYTEPEGKSNIYPYSSNRETKVGNVKFKNRLEIEEFDPKKNNHLRVYPFLGKKGLYLINNSAFRGDPPTVKDLSYYIEREEFEEVTILRSLLSENDYHSFVGDILLAAEQLFWNLSKIPENAEGIKVEEKRIIMPHYDGEWDSHSGGFGVPSLDEDFLKEIKVP